MFRRSCLWLQRSLMSDPVATKHATTKNIRRPKLAGTLMKRERVRRRRQQRGRDLFAKEAHTKLAMANVSDARDVVMAQLADQIFSKGHTHVATATNVSFVVDGNPATPLVALAGRGRVGKTSLLRSLFRSPTQVGKSNRTLRRDAMNYFNVGDVFNVVDLPGYGGTSVPWATVLQHAVLLRNFVRFQPSLKMLYYCLDVHYKHGLYVQDMDMLKFLSREVPNFTIVVTKGDQINESDRAQHNVRIEDVRRELAFNDIHHPVLVTSAYRMGGIDTLRFDMVMNALHALPTERLTFTEARRLSDRLYSQKELSTVQQLAIAPSQLDDDLREWRTDVKAEYSRGAQDSAEAAPTSQRKTPHATNNESSHADQEDDSQHTIRAPGSVDGRPAEKATALADGTTEFEPAAAEVAAMVEKQLLAVKDDDDESRALAASAFAGEPDKQLAYANLLKKARNSGLQRFVKETSPWRDPTHWPRHVIPTKHPKSNLLRCPEDPLNPYLTQPQFVVPRADLYFRRPNVGVRRSSHKGRYEADRPLQYLLKEYTVPYFPEIVDAEMSPEPWTFLGSREAFYERGGGRQLGVRLTAQARAGEMHPLSDNPAPDNARLTHEVRALEGKRYGTAIAMLRPPEDGEDALLPSTGEPQDG